MDGKFAPARFTHLNEPGVHPPPVDHAPLYLAQLARLALFIQLVQTASCRTAAILRVLRERDRPLHAVLLHLRGCLVRERPRIAERDVCLMRCG